MVIVVIVVFFVDMVMDRLECPTIVAPANRSLDTDMAV